MKIMLFSPNFIGTKNFPKMSEKAVMLVEQCVQMHIFFWKQPGCALIIACELIRTNMVYEYDNTACEIDTVYIILVIVI